MPLHRRLPKVGFVSRSKGETVELRLHELALPEDEVVNIDSLKRAGVIANHAKRVKVIASGKMEKAVRTQGLAVTPGARKAIEAAGGTDRRVDGNSGTTKGFEDETWQKTSWLILQRHWVKQPGSPTCASACFPRGRRA